jgi:Protein of unknown function (DUF3710)
VGIFRRGNKDTGSKETGVTERNTELRNTELNPVVAATASDRGADSDGARKAALSRSAMSRSRGPFDRSEVDGLEGRLDLGALWLTGTPGMELRLEVEQESQSLVGVTAVLGDSAVQLQAFAAPRSEGIWDDIRTEIAASITSQGGTADKTSGPLGAELQARMPGQDPDGRTVFSPARFIGVDGPRWFLRAVLSGQAAIDEEAASALLDVVRATVVVRGGAAMPPRELLELKLPDQPDLNGTEDPEGIDDHEVADHETTKVSPSLDDLKPFERGPEITEIH